jgi:hypothetical protein
MAEEKTVSSQCRELLRCAAMADETDQAEAIRRLSASVTELRAELLVSQASLAGLMAEVARISPEPTSQLGDSVARLLGFADSAAKGLALHPGMATTAPTAAALRIAEWAEGILTAKQ